MEINGPNVSLTASEVHFVHQEAGVFRRNLDLAERLYRERVEFARPFLPPYRLVDAPPRFGALHDRSGKIVETSLFGRVNEQMLLLMFIAEMASVEAEDGKDERGIERHIVTLAMSQEELTMLRERAEATRATAQEIVEEELSKPLAAESLVGDVDPEMADAIATSDDEYYAEHLNYVLVADGIMRAIDASRGTPPTPLAG